MLPRLRFKGFDGEYIQYKLGDIFGSLESGVSVNSEDTPISGDECGVLKTSCISDGIFYSNENKKIIPSEIHRAKVNPVLDSMIVSRMNTPLLVGEVGYVAKDYPNLFFPDRLWLVQVSNKKLFSTRWLTYQLTTKKLKARIRSIASGTSGSMKNISQQNFSGLEVFVPEFNEQQKILTFLSLIDHKIKLLVKKHNLLSRFKRGLSFKLFTQEVRFKNAEGKAFPDWTQQRLANMGEIITGTTPDTSRLDYYENGSSLFVSPADIGSQRYLSSTKTTLTDLGKKSGRNVRANSVLFVSIGSTIGKVAQNTVDCITNQQINAIVANDQFDNAFIYSLLEREAPKIKLLAGTHAVPIINKSSFSQISFVVPQLEEQRLISNCLLSYDKKLMELDSQIRLMNNFKQGLLQQMFI